MARRLLAAIIWMVVFMILMGFFEYGKSPYHNAIVTHTAAPVAPSSTTAVYPSVTAPLMEPTGTLVTYVYTESSGALENLLLFVDNGLHNAADFVFVLNGLTDAAKFIPTLSNVHVVPGMKKCLDLSVHGEVLTQGGLWNNYGRFIMLGSGVRGPMLPPWNSACWSDVFLSRITNETKLVGMTAKCLPDLCIESTIWATDRVGLYALLYSARGADYSMTAFGGCYGNKSQVTENEIQATDVIKQAGFKVDALMVTDSEKYCIGVDNLATDPTESLFTKGGRAGGSITHNGRRPSKGSWDVCRRNG
ncbi:hypothetical protein GGR53DRAFT_464489 [Hypoxylon sp. FL1150]|nr:hypothetical protein GGR53DRAFT_464489 [Hypoxylon sp. FL1150]